MEIQSNPQPIQQRPTTREADPIIRVSGEYLVLKEKSKSEILTVSEKVLMSAIDTANKNVQGKEHEFNYKIHKSTGDLIVQILDKDTHEVIREVPPEKFIDLIEKLQELSVGAIIDEKR
ncbi:flagellar protein FlaG [Cohnella mopanensis]|uniref:flagellar protein FlaG n=1 Tax=Cohnella mopanensis TaxID=2911966 RepID=UPI001EF9A82B|nr:flagellar protein FlaG [Cohnella mopanensis]